MLALCAGCTLLLPALASPCSVETSLLVCVVVVAAAVDSVGVSALLGLRLWAGSVAVAAVAVGPVTFGAAVLPHSIEL